MEAKDGEFCVRAARKAIEAETEERELVMEFPEGFEKKSGVFVTLKTYPDNELRGCIGYPEPFYPLKDALVYAAQSACHDPRFPPLAKEECSSVTVEVTILSKPEQIIVRDRSKLPETIKVGRDGLILEFGRRRGLLLPQVPVEWNWGAVEFLENLCVKAGLPTNAWMLKEAEIYSFTGEIFSEESPNGRIRRE